MSYGIVYQAKFPNGLVYIGQTKQSLDKRKAQHMRTAQGGSKELNDNALVLFHKAIKSFGEPKWSELWVGDSAISLDVWEAYYIELSDSTNLACGYNTSKGHTKALEGHRYAQVAAKEKIAKLEDMVASAKVIIAYDEQTEARNAALVLQQSRALSPSVQSEQAVWVAPSFVEVPSITPQPIQPIVTQYAPSIPVQQPIVKGVAEALGLTWLFAVVVFIGMCAVLSRVEWSHSTQPTDSPSLNTQEPTTQNTKQNFCSLPPTSGELADEKEYCASSYTSWDEFIKHKKETQ
jgi:hypothetical protein